MSDIVIKAEGLGKKYLIGHQSERERYTALRDVVVRNVKGVLNKTRQVLSGQQLLAGDEIEEFWALKDIDFEIKRGDRVGIIGRNGAGKSTLLKVLSRITEPSKGRLEIHGRVASLLEVGTGFHPELTGRENIFLNGAILGMTRAEIKKKFDEIVDFAGVEKFLDTPVKRYSSGMYVRLAFAVAAHLEPEILVVDEVLAVGDAEFQKKCLGKMEDVSKNEGRTVLFVSHSMNAINLLCKTCIFLESGSLIRYDKSSDVVNQYLSNNLKFNNNRIWENHKMPGSNIVKLKSVRIVDINFISKDEFLINEKIGIEIIYHVLKGNHILWLGCNLHNTDGINVFDTHSVSSEYYINPHNEGVYKAIVWIPQNFLAEGTFIISVAIFNHKEHVVHLHEKEIVLFNVVEDLNSLTSRGYSVEDFPGVVRPMLNWEITKNNKITIT